MTISAAMLGSSSLGASRSAEGTTPAPVAGASRGQASEYVAASTFKLTPATVITLSALATTQASGSATAQKDFTTVTKDARSTIDAKYAEMESSGKPFDYMHSTGKDWENVFGGLDRRSLYAVYSNSGGQFTDEEQKVAGSIMSQRSSSIMKAADPLENNHPAAYKAYVSYLDDMSAEEKASTEWMVQRASAQFGFEQTSRDRGEVPENLDSGNPLVNMIKKAMEGLKNQAPRAIATGAPVKDLKDMPLFKDGYFGAELREAMDQIKPVDVTA